MEHPDQQQKLSRALNDSIIKLTDSLKLYHRWKGTFESANFYNVENNLVVDYSVSVPLGDNRKLLLHDTESCKKDALTEIYTTLKALKTGDEVYFDGMFKREYKTNLYFFPAVSKDLSDLSICDCGLKFGFFYLDTHQRVYDGKDFLKTLDNGKMFYDSVGKYMFDGQSLKVYSRKIEPLQAWVYADTAKLNADEKYYLKKYVDHVFWQSNSTLFEY
jgi:hypothetical protein